MYIIQWKLILVYNKRYNIYSEGGTEEDRRINPPLNFGIFIENNNKIWKKWLRSSPRLIIKNSDPPLYKFHSALTIGTILLAGWKIFWLIQLIKNIPIMALFELRLSNVQIWFYHLDGLKSNLELFSIGSFSIFPNCQNIRALLLNIWANSWPKTNAN